MAPGELFLVASNIHFLDDTGLALGHAPVHQEALTAGNGSLEPQDDVFYLSRLNDPTTYFFQWICKRYRLTVKAEPHSCPICLETSENNIQLSCGHTFCRQCLKAAAEREMTSCALCRKSHTLDPDVLRAQFDQQRVANLSWRLGQTRAARAFSKPSWEAAAGGAAFASPLARSKEALLASSAAVGGGGGASWAAAAEAEADDVKKLSKSASTSSARGDSHDAPDIGALPRSLLLRRARASVKRALLNRDAGGMAPSDLASRWTRLMGGQGAAAVLPPDVGAAPVAEMRDRWTALLAPATARSALDVGAASADEVRAREARLVAVGELEAGDCGAAPVAELAARWRAAASHFEAPSDAGAAPAAALRAAWEGTARVGAIGRDVGALATAELLTAAKPATSAVALSPECGAAPIPALTARLRAAQALVQDKDVGAMARLSSSVVPAGALPEECGALPQPALAGRWAALLAASAAGEDAGASSAASLAARWAGGMGLAEEAGAASVAEMRGRWRGLLEAGSGRDVGACDAAGLAGRWRGALTA